MKKAIIIGASSGIGKALARELVQNKYSVGITGRREAHLLELQKEQPEQIQVAAFDTTEPNAIEQLEALEKRLGGIDLFIISAGIGHLNLDYDYSLENETNQLNVVAFTRLVNWSMRYFEKQGWGHLVNISSVASRRGGRQAPAYSASKAYQSIYLEGMAQKVAYDKLPIYTTDVRPGFVKTAMAKADKMFWVSSKEKAATQIFRSIQRKKRIVYISRRWVIIAWILERIPWFIYKRM
ncbi:SDR family NAD(P)-dependent oxidoreductase [Candidatus Arcticimaribacter forsetii]|uniref:SDR family NAD(P)-dependent oxidoreductase n=1 Tax=Candidatus Arcticimaribacter forsetii TaxID=2820661 RepID=UPI0020775AB2|nr:SDR family NAD(P)-dependent oxidoreductase [Candidatus Arcticimaribacter forsetii]MDB2329985.1 SDR family NAD(P)-dependent oxidoreductase [Flavobacteriaceae bacterium]